MIPRKHVTLHICNICFLAPVEGLFYKPKYRANIFNCLFFYFISVSIFSPCRKDQFAVLTFYRKISLVCRCGFAVIIVFVPALSKVTQCYSAHAISKYRFKYFKTPSLKEKKSVIKKVNLCWSSCDVFWKMN